jgi:GT2 family glycosyltransferase
VKTCIYIPNFNGERHLDRVLRALRAQTAAAEVVIADNGSTDGSAELIRGEFPEVRLLELGENLGFGRALNRAIEAHPADAVILLNNDTEPEPRFVEALLDGLGPGVDSVAGVLLQERAPELIDSAGVLADRTAMGFDHLHGEPATVLASAPDPLGPTGGAALYRREAFAAVGGFDERIFLYYEDLDLALRLAAAGGRCRLAPEARALHAYSASLGARSGAKFARTGWSRGYLLRRYGVMRAPLDAARVLLVEGAICAGQLVKARTSAGLRARVRGYRAGAGLPRRELPPAGLLEISPLEALRHRAGRG